MGFFKNELVAEQEEFDTYRARVALRKQREREMLMWWFSGLFLGMAVGLVTGVLVVI